METEKKLNQLLMERLGLMDDTIDKFNVEEEQTNIFNAIKRYLQKNLDLDSEGNIKKTAKNIKTVQKVKLLRNILISDGYKKKVADYIASFDKVRSLSDEYITKM